MAALGRSLQIERYFPDALVRRLCNCLPKPPSLPYSYLQLVRELERRGCSMESVSQIISQDEAVTTMFLRMVNSVAMGLQRPVSSVAEAMLFLVGNGQSGGGLAPFLLGGCGAWRCG